MYEWWRINKRRKKKGCEGEGYLYANPYLARILNISLNQSALRVSNKVLASQILRPNEAKHVEYFLLRQWTASHINLLLFNSWRPSSTCCRTFMCNSEPLCQFFYIRRVADTQIDLQCHSELWKHQLWGLMTFLILRSTSYISVSQMSGTDWSRLFSLKRKTCWHPHLTVKISTSSSRPGYLFHFLFALFIYVCGFEMESYSLPAAGFLSIV